MKIASLIAFLVALFTPGAIYLQTSNFNRIVDFSSGGDLRISTDVGSVRLTSWDQEKVEVVARIEGRTNNNVSADYARRAVEATRIEMTGDNRSLNIKANYDDVPNDSSWGGRNRVIPRIEWDIRAPRSANINLDVDRSEAEISGFQGKHKLSCDRTPIRVENMSGDISIHIDRGNDSKLVNLQGSLNVEADRTDLTFDRLLIQGDSRVEIGRGKLELRVPSTQGLQLNFHKERRSTFQSEFPITTSNLNEDRIEGSINGGGPRLTINTDRARVFLKNN